VHVAAIAALVVDPVRNKIYVAHNFGHSVTVIDGATNRRRPSRLGKAPGIALTL